MYYQSGNRNKDAFSFYESGSMIDFYQRLKTGRITFEESKSKLKGFNGLLAMLINTVARKGWSLEKCSLIA